MTQNIKNFLSTLLAISCASLYAQAYTSEQPAHSSSCYNTTFNETHENENNPENKIDNIIKSIELDNFNNDTIDALLSIPKDLYPLLKSKLNSQIDKHPSDYVWPLYLAKIEELDHQFKSAISLFNKAYSIEPNTAILKSIAQCYASLKMYNEAADYIERAIILNPKDYSLLIIKADYLTEAGLLKNSLKARNEYIAHNNNDAMGYIRRAENFRLLKKYDEAINDINNAIALNPQYNNVPYIYLLRGNAYRFLNKINEANTDYIKILELEKDVELDAYSCSPNAYAYLGDSDKAINYATYILNNDKRFPASNYYNLASIHAYCGNKEMAMEYLSLAVKNGFYKICEIKNNDDFENIRDLEKYKDLMIDNDFTTYELELQEIDGYFIIEVPIRESFGINTAKCYVNDTPTDFIFNSNIADATMSLQEARIMLNHGWLNNADIIYKVIDEYGDMHEGSIINLLHVNINGIELNNVQVKLINNPSAPLILGKSIISQFHKIEIDRDSPSYIIYKKATDI